MVTMKEDAMRTFFESVENGEWERVAAAILKDRMKMEGVNFIELSERLRPFGHDEHNRNLSGRINRGRFSAAFMLQCLSALGATGLDVPKRAGTSAKVTTSADAETDMASIEPRG